MGFWKDFREALTFTIIKLSNLFFDVCICLYDLHSKFTWLFIRLSFWMHRLLLVLSHGMVPTSTLRHRTHASRHCPRVGLQTHGKAITWPIIGLELWSGIFFEWRTEKDIFTSIPMYIVMIGIASVFKCARFLAFPML